MPRRIGDTRRPGQIALLLILLSGCDTTQNERVRLYNQDGIEQFTRGNFRNAADSFQEALVLKPGDPVLSYNLAQSYDRMGNVKQAELYYQECLKGDAALPDARQSYANLLVRTGRGDNAGRLIENWSGQEGSQTEVFVLQAWKLRQEKQYPEAYNKLQAALAKEPHNPRALTELGLLYEKMNLPDRSLALYERVLLQNPNQFEVRERVATLKAQGVGAPLPSQ